MEEDNPPFLQPLLSSAPFPPPAPASPSNELEDTLDSRSFRINSSSNGFGIILRAALVLSIGMLSIWANHEESKGFSISVVNEAPDRLSGRRFDLFYVSNDGASRLLLTTSKFVENFLYPNTSYPKKQVSQVTLRLSGRNLSQPVIVDSSGEDHDQFVIHVSPSILEEINFKEAMFEAMQHGMVRLWLWDGLGDAPSNLVDGLVEYVSKLAISGGMPSYGSLESDSGKLDGHCWKRKKAKAVARFLYHWEMEKPGFIQRLNQAMRNGWRDRMVDDALGMQVQHLCDAHNSSRKY